ncbi:MAG: alpha/beta hydrolase-fold protein [Acidobacteriota bacterium]
MSAWISTFLLVMLAAAAGAQVPSARPQDPATPVFAADNRVTFRIRAPKASEVWVSTNLGGTAPKPAGTVKDQPGMWNVPLQKDATGLWTVTVGPLEPEIYRYVFLVDGVRTLDSSNPSVKPGGTLLWSYFEVAGHPPRFDEVQDVPHGSVQFRTYRVTGSKALHTVVIYVPPDYDRLPARRFPVLYLFHSGGDSEEGWVRLGHVAAIQENLLAQKKTVPMLVVMPYGDIEGDATAFDAIDTFGREVFDDVMPLVEKNYRVVANRDNRAVAGVSVGAAQAFTLGLRNLDRFAWVGEFSAGTFTSAKFDMDKQVPGFIQNPAVANKKLKLLFLGCGTEDTRFPGHTKLNDLLEKNAVAHEFHQTPGEHEWKAWRHLLVEFMPKLFQPTK